MASHHAKREISAVICAYNEAPRIAHVLRAVCSHPNVHEVIVIDDGSTDETSAIVAEFPRVTLIVHEHNKGKTRAMATGIKAARHDYLMFLDADLISITANDISKLIEPVITGQSDVSISLRKNSLVMYRLIGIDFVSGERVVPRDVAEDMLTQLEQLPRFGAELSMNQSIIKRNFKIAVVDWQHVTHVQKVDKSGWKEGVEAELRMINDLFEVIAPADLVGHVYRMRRSCIPRALPPVTMRTLTSLFEKIPIVYDERNRYQKSEKTKVVKKTLRMQNPIAKKIADELKKSHFRNRT